VFERTLFAAKPNGQLRRQAAGILTAAVRAVEPAAAVKRFMSRRGHRLLIGARRYDLRPIRRILVVGAGKAGAPMAAAVEQVLGARITAGLVIVKYGYTGPVRRIRLLEAGHPLPDAAGERGATQMLDLLRGADADDLVVCLISGGGSALLPAPVPGVTLEDEIVVTDLLLRSGATIQEVNAVRKHLSQVKGGRLAAAAAPARVVALILSDVVGNPLDAIASGPVTPDPTTFADALAVVQRYHLETRMPAGALAHLRRGAAGQVPETPKPGDPLFRRVQVIVVGDNAQALAAAADRAKAVGFRTLVLTPFLEGEAREAARVFVSVARGIKALRTPVAPPACLLAGGETTVTVRGQGRGGRCQEFALAAGQALAGWPDTVVAGFGTDGTDGPTDAAGALVDGETVARARSLSLDPARALADNDSYAVFHGLGDLLMTGPTKTNVNDIYLALVRPAKRSRTRTVIRSVRRVTPAVRSRRG
jgi:hydroxypyruvate reductase